MAKKKTSSNVDYLAGYVPATFTPQINPAQIAQIPPYEDQGVKFQGFSKRLIGGTYQLFPQQRFFIQDNAANTLTTQTAFTVPQNRKLFISSIWFSGTAGSSTDSWTLRDGALFISLFQNFSNHQEQIIFDPPLEFKDSLKWEMNQDPSQLYLNFFGWLE